MQKMILFKPNAPDQDDQGSIVFVSGHRISQ